MSDGSFAISFLPLCVFTTEHWTVDFESVSVSKKKKPKHKSTVAAMAMYGLTAKTVTGKYAFREQNKYRAQDPSTDSAPYTGSRQKRVQGKKVERPLSQFFD